MDWVQVLTWWAAAEFLGLLALPLAMGLFSRLPSRGYIFSKPLGILLTSYILWIGASLKLLPNTRASAWVALGLMGVFSLIIGRSSFSRRGRQDILAWYRQNWKFIVTAEVLFFFVFLAWAEVRSFYPDLYTGEKRMEFAFINGILNSRWFPPQDPWLAGFAINYYYFGHLMIAVLVRLTGTDLAIGFTLAAVLWYALTLAVSFGLVSDLVRSGTTSLLGTESGSRRSGDRRPILFGLLGAMLVGVIGNLAGVVRLAYELKLAPENWIRWLDLKVMVRNPPTGVWPPGDWWWMNRARVIHDIDPLGNVYEAFTEFPFVTFLAGELHAQAFNLPFIVAIIGLAVNIFLGARTAKPAGGSRLASARDALSAYTGLGLAGAILPGVMLGGLAFVHSWDAIVCFFLLVVAAALGITHRVGRFGRETAVHTALLAVPILLCAYLCYRPFYANLRAPVSGLTANLFFPTRLGQFLIIFGVFLPPLIGFLLLVGRETDRVLRRAALILPWTLLVPPAVAILIALARFRAHTPSLQGLWISPETTAAMSQWPLAQVLGSAASTHSASPWTWLMLAVLLAWGMAVVGGQIRRPKDLSMDTVVLAMVLLGLAVTLALEFVYIDEPLGTRTNSLYKFYYQAWILFAIAAAYGFSRVLQAAARPALRKITSITWGLLVVGALFYPVAALPDRANHFRGQQTLDSLAYLRIGMADDMAAIQWLRVHAAPDAIILEAPAGDYGVGHDNIVSTLTGNPTLIGWWDHEIHWRGVESEQMIRERSDVAAQIYLANDPDTIKQLLARWHIDYLYVGNVERAHFGLDDQNIQLYDLALRPVFSQGGVRVYILP